MTRNKAFTSAGVLSLNFNCHQLEYFILSLSWSASLKVENIASSIPGGDSPELPLQNAFT